MKKLILSTAVVFALMAGYTSFAQEAPENNAPRENRERGGRGFNRGDRGDRGFNRGERGFNRGERGFNRGNFGPMRNPRFDAEKQLKEKYPAEFAEIQKLRDEAETKLQELAKKANIQLPPLPKSREERMAELKKKFPEDYAEYEKLMQSDRRAAFAKLGEMMKKAGVETFAPPAPRRENQARQIQDLRKKYPEEWKKIRKIQKENPEQARKMINDLIEKSKKEKESEK